MKILTTLLFILTSVNFAAAQPLQLPIKQIDSIVYTIDTTKDILNTIVDGTLRIKGKRKAKGGFSDTYLLSAKTHKLLKVVRGQSLYFRDYSEYYFVNDSLVFVKTSRYSLSSDSAKIISNGRYYFVNDILVDKVENGPPATRPELFISNAKRYLVDAKTVFPNGARLLH